MLYEKVSSESKNIVFVYTTCYGVEEAREIGLVCIREKLAISADYWPINSIYPWNKVIREGEQYMLMFATEQMLSDTLMKKIEEEHSYSVPVIIKCSTAITSPTYHFWVNTTLSNKEPYTILTDAELKAQNENGSSYERLK